MNKLLAASLFIASGLFVSACSSTEKAEEAPLPRYEEIVIERVFNAPPDRVWKSWTDPKLIKRWWGPKGFTAPDVKIDLREGGKYLYSMKSPEGQKFWSTGVFKEIVKNERIVATDSFADEKGNVVPATHYQMSPDFPMELTVTTTFEKLPGRKTKLTLRQGQIPVGPMVEMTKAGWGESLDKLAKTLK